jgi:hypothetical protein
LTGWVLPELPLSATRPDGLLRKRWVSYLPQIGSKALLESSDAMASLSSMSEEFRDAGAVEETRGTGWSCPFCDAENPRTGDELDLTIDVSQVELRCDYCETISVHLTCPP